MCGPCANKFTQKLDNNREFEVEVGVIRKNIGMDSSTLNEARTRQRSM